MSSSEIRYTVEPAYLSLDACTCNMYAHADLFQVVAVSDDVKVQSQHFHGLAQLLCKVILEPQVLGKLTVFVLRLLI